MRKRRVSFTVGSPNARLLWEALDYASEDLKYRMDQGMDFEPDDIPELRKKLDQMDRLMNWLVGR